MAVATNRPPLFRGTRPVACGTQWLAGNGRISVTCNLRLAEPHNKLLGDFYAVPFWVVYRYDSKEENRLLPKGNYIGSPDNAHEPMLRIEEGSP